MPTHEELEHLIAAMAAAEPPLPADEEDEDEPGLVRWSVAYKTFRN